VPPQPVHLPHHQEDHEGEDQEVHRHGDEIAPGQHRHARLLQAVQRHGRPRRRVAQHDEQVGEIELADDAAQDRHHDVADQRLDDLAEGGADDHADRQVDHVAHDARTLGTPAAASMVGPLVLGAREYAP
jgi:hypothetical protein